LAATRPPQHRADRIDPDRLLNQPAALFQEVITMNARHLFRYARYALAALASVGFGFNLQN
jgi:hypothetical protein